MNVLKNSKVHRKQKTILKTVAYFQAILTLSSQFHSNDSFCLQLLNRFMKKKFQLFCLICALFLILKAFKTILNFAVIVGTCSQGFLSDKKHRSILIM